VWMCGGCASSFDTHGGRSVSSLRGAAALAGGITLVAARCTGATSCVIGQVVAAESGQPLARAAIFLVGESAADPPPLRGPDRLTHAGTNPDPESAHPRPEPTVSTPTLVAWSDDQGVFAIPDAPPGRYRIAVYQRGRSIEVRGLQLPVSGTTMLPIRLPAPGYERSGHAVDADARGQVNGIGGPTAQDAS